MIKKGFKISLEGVCHDEYVKITDYVNEQGVKLDNNTLIPYFYVEKVEVDRQSSPPVYEHIAIRLNMDDKITGHQDRCEQQGEALKGLVSLLVNIKALYD